MSNLSIQVCSDLDYERMVVDICENEERIATLNCDNGLKNAEIVFYNMENENPFIKLNFFEFAKILDDSFQKLKELNSL
jgi:hypothetical protein